MNKHYILSLFDKELKTVGVRFFNGDKIYTYKTRETFENGDNVVVRSQNGGFAVAEVVRVDEEPDIDADSKIDYTWVVQKVDASQYVKNVARDKELNEHIARTQKEHHRQAARASLLAEIPGLASLGLDLKTEQPADERKFFDEGSKAREFCKTSGQSVGCPYAINTPARTEWLQGYHGLTFHTITPPPVVEVDEVKTAPAAI